MDIIIWGAGTRGKRLYDILGSERVIAFIDNNIASENINGKSVINFDTYIKYFNKNIIVVSNLWEIPIIRQLDENQIPQFLLYNDCPEQMMQNCDMDRVKKYIYNSIGSSDIAIYGISIYSLLVYEWIKEHGNQVYLIKNNSCSENISSVVSRLKNYNIVSSEEELPKSVKKILISIASEEPVISKLDKIDIFDFSNVFTEQWHPELKQFHNIHKDKRCFIVATGPSLKIEDLDCLKRHHEICISMNKIFYSFDETEWRPDYYTVSDWQLLRLCKQEIINLEAKVKFISDYVEEFWADCHSKNIYGFREHISGSTAVLFSDDISKCMHGAPTVTYMAIQLAAYMGIREIYLLGVDHSGGAEVNAPERHFYGNKDTKAFKMRMSSDNLIYLERSYMIAERYSRAHGFRIYNATRGGNLEVFERKKFDELFEDK